MMGKKVPKSGHIKWHPRLIGEDERASRNGHVGAILWFTGLSGSGKSTLATTLEKALFERGCQTYVLDGDNVRHGLNNDLGFSPEDRTENIRRVGEVANLMRDAGLVVMTAFISPYRADRQAIRELTPEGRFIEIFVDCPLEACEQRDPKGLYKKARAGQIGEFTGISAPYEPPLNPEIVVKTAGQSLAESVDFLMGELARLAILERRRAGRAFMGFYDI